MKKKNIIVIDTETTGFSPDTDDILQISIIDGDGNTLVNEYCKPTKKSEWKEAMAVNNITPETVSDKPTFSEILSKVQSAIDGADIIVGYNHKKFDNRFLEKNGVIIDTTKKQKDVMFMFAPIFGEKFKNGTYKFKSLSTAATFFNYTFSAHDSLEDCKATLFCYTKIVSDKNLKKIAEASDRKFSKRIKEASK